MPEFQTAPGGSGPRARRVPAGTGAGLLPARARRAPTTDGRSSRFRSRRVTGPADDVSRWRRSEVAEPCASIPLPSGRAHYEGLKSAFVDFPRLLRTLRSDRHTGYVNLSGTGYSGVILLNDGQALQALCSNGTAVQGEDAFLQIRRHMDAGDGVIDVIELDGETVTALAQLFTSPYLYSGLLGASSTSKPCWNTSPRSM